MFTQKKPKTAAAEFCKAVSSCCAALFLLFLNPYFYTDAAVGMTYLCDYPAWCDGGTSCPYGNCVFTGYQGYCEPWENMYGEIEFAAYEERYDCDGDSCVCQPSCWSGFCSYRTEGECLKEHGFSGAYPSVQARCEDPGPPEQRCDTGDLCCLDSGGGAGGSGGPGDSLFSIMLLDLQPHSLAPRFVLRYNHRNKLNRGLGMGWAHSYLYCLEKNENTGHISCYTETGGNPWLYREAPDGTYLGAPYDRTIFSTKGNGYSAVGRDGRTFTYTGSGTLEHITDLSGNRLTMEYDENNQLVRVSDDFGRHIHFTYSDGCMSTITDPNGNSYRLSYQTVKW